MQTAAQAKRFVVGLHLQSDWQMPVEDRRVPLRSFIDRAMASLRSLPGDISSSKMATTTTTVEMGDSILQARAILSALLSLVVRAARGELIRKPKYREGQVQSIHSSIVSVFLR